MVIIRWPRLQLQISRGSAGLLHLNLRWNPGRCFSGAHELFDVGPRIPAADLPVVKEEPDLILPTNPPAFRHLHSVSGPKNLPLHHGNIELNGVVRYQCNDQASWSAAELGIGKCLLLPSQFVLLDEDQIDSPHLSCLGRMDRLPFLQECL